MLTKYGLLVMCSIILQTPAYSTSKVSCCTDIVAGVHWKFPTVETGLLMYWLKYSWRHFGKTSI